MSIEAMKLALEALMHEMKYVLCCINLDKVPFDGDDFHEALRLGEEALANHIPDAKKMGEQEQGEIERLTAALEKANAQAEHFEREWYLRCDELEKLKQEQGDPSPSDAANKAGPVWEAFNGVYEAIASRPITIREIAWRCFLAAQPKQEQGEPVAMAQVYRCKIKSRKQIDREIPREKQGWWADISAGELIRLREATQADVDRCTLNGAHSKDPADYMCETHTNGSLVLKVALEYMNPEQNVFAAISDTHPQPKREPLLVFAQECVLGAYQESELADAAQRAIKAAHVIKENT